MSVIFYKWSPLNLTHLKFYLDLIKLIKTKNKSADRQGYLKVKVEYVGNVFGGKELTYLYSCILKSVLKLN